MKIILFKLLLISFFCQAQTIEQILKNNTSKTCNCIEKLDYIDSKIDFENKFDKCSLLTKNDSIRVVEKMSLDKYKDLLNSELTKNCNTIMTKVNEIKKSYTLSASDSIYQTNTNYKEQEKKIIGQYHFRSNNPEGGTRLYIYNQNKYVIISFGEMQIGTWKIVREKYLHLIPYKRKHLFRVYGRHNSEIGDATKTAFMGDSFSHNTLIHYGENINSDTLNLTPIFNIGANCFRFPYKGKIKKIHNSISLGYNWNNKMINLYTFKNKQKFNDFIIYENIKMNTKKQTRAIIDNGNLIFRKNRITKRKDLPKETTEDRKFLNQIVQESYNQPKTVYYNFGCKKFNEKTINSKFYNFNKDLNAFISIKKCIGEGCPDKNDYDYSLRVNKYESLEDVTQHKKLFSIKDKSIIYSVCD